MTDFHIAQVDGLLYAVNTNIHDIVQQTIINGNVWEPRIVELFREHVRLGDIVLDIGANMGAHTIQLARIVGRYGEVLAFEPQQHFTQQIIESVILNGFGDAVIVYPYAVGDASNEVKIEFVDPDLSGGQTGQVQIFRGDAVVNMVKIDDLALTRLNFMKIDVETYEHLVIDGAMDTIRRCRPIIIYEYFPHERSPEIHTKLLSIGYSVSPIRNCPYDWIATPINRL